jgi:hypothetical protein
MSSGVATIMSFGMPIPISLRRIFLAVLRRFLQDLITRKSRSLSGPISSSCRRAKKDNLLRLGNSHNSPHDFLKDLVAHGLLSGFHIALVLPVQNSPFLQLIWKLMSLTSRVQRDTEHSPCVSGVDTTFARWRSWSCSRSSSTQNKASV